MILCKIVITLIITAVSYINVVNATFLKINMLISSKVGIKF